MKQSTISVGFILLSIAVLYAKATSTCSCSCGGHDHLTGKDKKHESRAPLIKQCTFRKLNDDRNQGEVKTCDFQKLRSNSALRVTYQGDIRLVSCSSNCCRRWFITINAKECSSPAPIDAVIYANGVRGLNIHRPGTLDGFCHNIPKGRVTIGLSVENCNKPYVSGDAFTCWNSICRFIIEEVPSLQ